MRHLKPHLLAQREIGSKLIFMHHGSARAALTGVLAGHAFDSRALALLHAARLIEWHDHAQKWLSTAENLPPQAKSATQPAPLAEAVPEEQADLCAQLSPLITDHPGHVGTLLASLEGIIALWPHASRDERLRLRRRWLAPCRPSQNTMGAKLNEACCVNGIATCQHAMPSPAHRWPNCRVHCMSLPQRAPIES